ncbi:MAG: GNAT family N-acetyltransferase [Rhodobacteraceae bacterium]|jgi:GNAT superfamily N-acetyltransferase|nr:GNAT family N-acetyltransferase [Paracoccaceae bacterium]
MAGTVLTLRTATVADIGAVDSLLARSYPRLLKADYPPSVMVTAVPLISRARPDLVASGRYYLAEDADGRLLGAGGWSIRGGLRGVAEVRHLATDPGALRKGIARRIVGSVLDAARDAGLVRIGCLSSRTAVPFYEAMGFRAAGSAEVTLAAGIVFPAVRMFRML